MFEQTIDKIKALSALIERQHKAEATKQAVENLATAKQWKDVSKSFSNRLRSKKEFSTQVSLSLYKKAKEANVFKHSQLAGNRLIDSSYALQLRTDSDVRNGRRWIDRLPAEMHNALRTIYKYYSINNGGQATIVLEGDQKPVRERNLNLVTYTMEKLAVTDLVTQEALYALPSEQYGDYLLEALLEHVYDRLEQEITNRIATNALVFNAAGYAGYIYRGATSASWHDLLSAMQREYQYQFQDRNFGIRYADTYITGRRALLGILNDRHNDTQYYLSDTHDTDSFVLEQSNIYWSEPLIGASDRLLVLSSEAFELHMLDAVEVYMERVAESAQEQNLYRLVAEVYFTVVPRLLGEVSSTWPALISNNALADRNAL